MDDHQPAWLGQIRGTGRLLVACSMLAVFAFMTACNRTTEDAAAEAGGDSVFLDVTDTVGVDFVHFNGATGEYYLPEIMGSGVALIDYDGDGDLYVTNFGPNVLYRNDGGVFILAQRVFISPQISQKTARPARPGGPSGSVGSPPAGWNSASARQMAVDSIRVWRSSVPCRCDPHRQRIRS